MQAILLYKLETWVLSASMVKRVEGTHIEFLQLITGKRSRRLGDGAWETLGAEGVREAAGTQLARIYIERWQGTVAQWVALRPLFEVCASETWYKGRGQIRKAWWRHEATEKQLWVTLEDSGEAKRRRRIGGEMGTQ